MLPVHDAIEQQDRGGDFNSRWQMQLVEQSVAVRLGPGGQTDGGERP
jgi:hypothetical protein